MNSKYSGSFAANPWGSLYSRSSPIVRISVARGHSQPDQAARSGGIDLYDFERGEFFEGKLERMAGSVGFLELQTQAFQEQPLVAASEPLIPCLPP